MLFCYLLGNPTHFCSHIKKLWKMCSYDWALQNASWDCHDYFHARKRGSVMSLWESQIFDIVGWLSNRRGRFMHFWLQAPNLAQMFLGSPWTDFEGVPRNRAFSWGGGGGGGRVVLWKYHNLLLQVYVIFCDRFYHGQNPLPDILSTSTHPKKSSLKMSHEKIFVRCLTCTFTLFWGF